MTTINLDFASLQKNAENFEAREKDSYIQSYPEFINYFKSLDHIGLHELIISSHFLYGWMPTILSLQLKQQEEVLKLLNSAKNGNLLNPEELRILKSCVNNSMVGLSKLLHFINPDIYAIWDSKIFKYITDKKSLYGIDRPDLYLSYLEALKGIAGRPDFESFFVSIKALFKYPISRLRAIEIVMFQAKIL